MSGMSDNETCEKCGYEEAEYYLDAGLLYKTISCPKCGWVVSYSREIWVRENSMYDSSIIEEDKK